MLAASLARGLQRGTRVLSARHHRAFFRWWNAKAVAGPGSAGATSVLPRAAGERALRCPPPPKRRCLLCPARCAYVLFLAISVASRLGPGRPGQWRRSSWSSAEPLEAADINNSLGTPASQQAQWRRSSWSGAEPLEATDINNSLGAPASQQAQCKSPTRALATVCGHWGKINWSMKVKNRRIAAKKRGPD